MSAVERGGSPISIVLADPHRVVRAGLALLLGAEPGLQVVSEADDLATCERRVAAYRPRVLVIEAQLPDGPGLPALARMLAIAPDLRIVVLTADLSPSVVREALRAGAAAYVPKTAPATELTEAVRAVAGGRTYLNPELGARIAAAGDDRPPAPDDLSARELEVLRLIALGHTNAEVAARLYLSVRTVESHRAHIQQKTRRATRAQLVAYARENRLV